MNNVKNFEAIEHYTRAVENVIKAYGDQTVIRFDIFREPIQGLIDKLINVLSLGSWASLKKKYDYNEFFHLYSIVTLDTGRTVRVEKNANITITPDGQGKGEFQNVSLRGKKITLTDLLESTRKRYGNYRFFGYDAFENNCQDFLVKILTSNGIGDTENIAFVKQDIEKLAGELPGFTTKLSSAITGLGSYIEHGIGRIGQALGFKKGGKVGRRRRGGGGWGGGGKRNKIGW